MELALYGYGGHAMEVAAQIDQPITFFIDDKYLTEETKPISEFDPTKYLIMVAVADSKDRFDMVQRLPKETQFFTFIHPTALILSDNVQVGVGSFIGANSILTTNIKLGKHTILNRGNQIGHDSEIGDYFSAMPGAIVSGNVKIHDCVYMGTNSSIKEKLSIYSLSTIGMNSCVVKHIKEPGVYVGVPVRKIK
jgi:sugar O-acyltransferase (sialic acid O-acetyltransferase NeuD family)